MTLARLPSPTTLTLSETLYSVLKFDFLNNPPQLGRKFKAGNVSKYSRSTNPTPIQEPISGTFEEKEMITSLTITAPPQSEIPGLR